MYRDLRKFRRFGRECKTFLISKLEIQKGGKKMAKMIASIINSRFFKMRDIKVQTSQWDIVKFLVMYETIYLDKVTRLSSVRGRGRARTIETRRRMTGSTFQWNFWRTNGVRSVTHSVRISLSKLTFYIPEVDTKNRISY